MYIPRKYCTWRRKFLYSVAVQALDISLMCSHTKRAERNEKKWEENVRIALYIIEKTKGTAAPICNHWCRFDSQMPMCTGPDRAHSLPNAVGRIWNEKQISLYVNFKIWTKKYIAKIYGNIIKSWSSKISFTFYDGLSFELEMKNWYIC